MSLSNLKQNNSSWHVLLTCGRFLLYVEPLCPVSIPNGKLHENCTSKVGDYCSDISCNYGYKKNENITQINCTEPGTWNYNSSMLCRGTYTRI